MKSRWVLAALALACIAGWNGCVKAKNPGSATTASMWVATAGDQTVKSYTINLTTGAIAQRGNAVPTGVQPQAMAITPDGNTVFIANASDNTISIYTRNSDSALTAVSCSAPQCNTGVNPVALAVDPSGQFLFAADEQSGDIAAFKIGSGSLTPIGTTPTETPGSFTSSPSALAVSPSGNFLYVANSAANTVLGFSFDSNGVLTPLPAPNPNPCGAEAPGYCVQVGSNPGGLAFSRCAGVATATSACAAADSNNLFVSNSGSNNISVFSACIQTSSTCAAPDGTLTPVSSGSSVAACCGPTTFMVDPSADFVYVVEHGSAQVGQFRYSPATGALTPLSPAAESTGTAPFSGGITSNTVNTNWVYVTNSGASSISAFSIASGKLIGLSTGPILVSGQPTAILVK
ncbi:MAG TPA: beta-propeller fold lactonase family protein [Terriglobales bacterium]|nr:beta-propeller fold lactonase family protein [Terriglobales bacterium]